MVLELLVVANGLDGGVAAGAREGDLHGLVEELEALDLLHGAQGGLGAVEDDEGLALSLQVRLGDDVDDVAILGEDGLKRCAQRLGLNALLEVAHVHTAHARKHASWSVQAYNERKRDHPARLTPATICVGVQ